MGFLAAAVHRIIIDVAFGEADGDVAKVTALGSVENLQSFSNRAEFVVGQVVSTAEFHREQQLPPLISQLLPRLSHFFY